MPREHIVQQGDTLVSIAYRYGFATSTIWEYEANDTLRRKRKRMDVLYPGDIVHIPDRTPKTVTVAVNQRHVFRRRSVPALLRLVLRHCNEPRAHLPYRLVVGGHVREGMTDEHGELREHVPADATRGELYLNGASEPLIIAFGHLDPIDTMSGVRKRLTNLGLSAPSHDELDSPEWRRAIAALQRRARLAVTGRLDDETRRALENLHDRGAVP